MIRIVLLGSGNIASHLITAFSKAKNVEVVQLYSRSEPGLETTSFQGDKTRDLNNLMEADCYLIAVSDDAIASLSNQLPFKNRLVVHTSGSVSMNELATQNRRGVFYPLQTFSKGSDIDFSNIPMCLEAENKADFELLSKISNAISNVQYAISSEKRQQLHLAAVFVCNFVNYLYQIGYEITTKNQLPFDILRPLILETAGKVQNRMPGEVQTGPAKRNDQKTIQKHLNAIDLPGQKELYKIISEAISKSYYGGKKL